MRPLLNALLTIAAAVIVGFIAIAALVWYSQERIVFQPPSPPYPEVDGVRRLDYAAEDGQALFAYLVGDPSPQTGLIIAFHGNADLAAWQIPWAREVAARTGRAVLLPEYRGYAGLSGTPSYRTAALDALAAHALAVQLLEMPAHRITLFGHSLGSAVAVELARVGDAQALVLQSPLTSARDMARLMFPGPLTLIWRWISRVHYDSEAVVRTLPMPVWVVHGGSDGVVPVAMGRRVFHAARSRGELFIVDGAGHNDLADHPSYWPWLARALAAPAGGG